MKKVPTFLDRETVLLKKQRKGSVQNFRVPCRQAYSRYSLLSKFPQCYTDFHDLRFLQLEPVVIVDNSWL